jgi:hypothetical protein
MPRRKKMDSEALTTMAINMQFYGHLEPSLDKNLGDILNWYNATCNDDQAREWLTEWLEELGRHGEILQLNAVPDEWTPRTAAWLARLALRGYPLSDHNIEYMEDQLTRSFSFIVDEPPVSGQEKTSIDKPNVQDHIREKASNLIGELEGMIDDKVIVLGWSFYDYLRSKEISGAVAARLLEHFEPIAGELLDAMDTKNEDLKEGYKKYSSDELEEIAGIYVAMVEDAERYVGNAKKLRAPRKKKAQSIEKVLKHFVYAKNSEEYKLASVDPSKIVGANELWTFNPKKKLLSVYRANDSDGLKIKRSMIVNINEQTSIAKKIGRKTDERLRSVLDGGKVVLRNLMDDITGKGMPSGRINKDTILMRIM